MNLSFVLILSMTTSVIAAKSKLSDSWEIDDSCDPPRLEKLEEAHSEIVELLTKVTNDLAHVQQPRPATRWGKPNWNRISRNLAGLFGLQPNDAIIENGYDPGEQYFSQVLYTYDRTYQALVNGKAVQENGYSGKLTDQSQHSKPLLLCGDTRTWERFEKDDPDKMEGSGIKVLTDQQAVDKNGCLLWSDGSARRVPESTNANGEQLQIQHVYSLRHCTHISRDQTNNQHEGQFEKDGTWVAGTLGNSGPSAATRTAETYAYFAIISYLDKWEWLTTGKASPL
ncbi:hypothetical protein FMEXI_5570 [Fusarium mexicanum]|uniref:Uncharacterized protein n=1 Tax=Fusarium mexicanum TaxID=751941 RepID=A0A8H5MZE8_9HYPO|nr:hypothetical protein FMEXI_5570 [Fusarium mexicanum]